LIPGIAQGTLPTFFIIGAAKCGTTSLHTYLDRHPDVSMTSEKEPNIFSEPDFESRLSQYAPMLEPGASARGEASVIYSQHPARPEVPERIHSVLPEARFVYLVRDPIDRAVSDYIQHVGEGKETRPITEALADVKDPFNPYVCASRYATQIQRYLDSFEGDRLLVLDQAELLNERDATLERVFEFVGVDPAFRAPEFDQVHNIRGKHRRPTALGRLARRAPRVLAAARGLPIPKALRQRGARVLGSEIEAPELDDEIRARIAAELADEVEWLRHFTGRPFAGWSV
jgi:hypothetical protein